MSISSLSAELLQHIISFLGPYEFLAKITPKLYLVTEGDAKILFENYVLELCRNDNLKSLLLCRFEPREKHLLICVEGGSLVVLEWFYDNHREFLEKYKETICDFSISLNKQEILEWMFSKNLLEDNSLCVKACSFGHLELLQWLLEIGCELDVDDFFMQCDYSFAKYPKILDFLYREKYLPLSEDWAADIINNGNLESLQWLLDNITWNIEITASLLGSWNIEKIKYVAERKPKIIKHLYDFLCEDVFSGYLKKHVYSRHLLGVSLKDFILHSTKKDFTDLFGITMNRCSL